MSNARTIIERERIKVRRASSTVRGRLIHPDELRTEETLHSSMQLLLADDHTQYVRHDAIAETSGIVEKTGASSYRAIKTNSAASAPTPDDDIDEGYAVGSTWLDTSAPAMYVCVDATATAAVWRSH